MIVPHLSLAFHLNITSIQHLKKNEKSCSKHFPLIDSITVVFETSYVPSLVGCSLESNFIAGGQGK